MKKTIKWVVILAVVGGGYWCYTAKVNKSAEGKPSYDQVIVEVRDLRTTVESTGEVQPRNRLDVKPPIAGRVEELIVDEGDLVEKGQILGWISSTERATLLDAALATSEDELQYWQDLYKPSPLISPLKGTIIARNFEPGQSIGANDAVVVIADDLIVVANLDETDIGQVKLAQKAVVRLEAYPDTKFPCVVEKIAYDAKLVSNVTMYEVDVAPKRLPSFARSGMTANLKFLIDEKKGVLAVPSSAIQEKSSGSRAGSKSGRERTSDAERLKGNAEKMWNRGRSDAEVKERIALNETGGGEKKGGEKADGDRVSFVLIASIDSGHPEKRIVKTGFRDGSFVEIVDGLEEGDVVLIQNFKLGARGSSSKSKNPFMPQRSGGRGRH